MAPWYSGGSLMLYRLLLFGAAGTPFVNRENQ
jgi:hypothetical protein